MEENTNQPQQDINQYASPSVNQESSNGASSSPMLLYGGIGIFIVILILLGGYILFTHIKAKPTSMMQAIPNQQQAQSMPTPVISPVTASNADQTLSNTDTSMQQTTDQMNTDLNSLNSVDTSQDNPNNL